MNNYALLQFLAPLQSAQKSRSGGTHTEIEYVTWNKTKQTRTILSAQKATSSGLSILSLTSGFDCFFSFFEDASTAWITMIPSTCDNFQSCLNSGEPDFSFISFWWLAIKKNLSVSTFDIALVCLGGAADAIETEHSCHSTHCYFTDGTIQFAV